VSSGVTLELFVFALLFFHYCVMGKSSMDEFGKKYRWIIYKTGNFMMTTKYLEGWKLMTAVLLDSM
jgi:hypothetical protein